MTAQLDPLSDYIEHVEHIQYELNSPAHSAVYRQKLLESLGSKTIASLTELKSAQQELIELRKNLADVLEIANEESGDGPSWKTEWTIEFDTDISFTVRQLPTGNWSWSAWDDVMEDSIVAWPMKSLGEARKAALNWYHTEWLPRFQETGEREFVTKMFLDLPKLDDSEPDQPEGI